MTYPERQKIRAEILALSRELFREAIAYQAGPAGLLRPGLSNSDQCLEIIVRIAALGGRLEKAR